MSEGRWELNTPRRYSAVAFTREERFNRRYWLALQLGWWFGPLVIAITGAKKIEFGIIDGDTFKWIKVMR